MIALAAGEAEIVLRPMSAVDETFDRALFDEDRGARFAALHLDGPMLALLLDQQYRARQLGYKAAYPDADHAVVTHGGNPVGRVTTALRHDDGPSLHVVEIIVVAAARGHGIGTAVMTLLDDVARTQGARRLTLSVMTGNHGARRFYGRLGFHAVGGDNADPSVAMVKSLDGPLA